MSEADSLFDYYSRQDVLPTFGNFQTQEALDRQERHRRNLYEEKLHLPVGLFNRANVLEFGPDSGENALVCAQWGAQLTLVEPNPKAVDRIRAYFTRFAKQEHLRALHNTDLASFGRDQLETGPFDFIIAEGFLNAVRPDRLWIDLFKRLLAPQGFVIIYTHEPVGMFTDSLLKVIQFRVRALSGLAPNDAAHLVFQGKWDAIPHIRTMESWVMDQIENPFVRLSACHDPIELGRTLAEGGLRTYSSWPPSTNTLDVCWHKTVLSEAELLKNQETFYLHNRLSYLLGRPLFCRQPAPEGLVERIIHTLDSLVDGYLPERAEQLRADLETLKGHVAREAIPLRAEDVAEAVAFLESTRAILALLTEGKVDKIATFCNHDVPFIRGWGLPVYFRVLRHSEPVSPLA